MTSLIDLPPEVLGQIVHQVTLGSGLQNWRLTNSYINNIATESSRTLLNQLCRVYQISDRVLHLYWRFNLDKAASASASQSEHPDLKDVIALNHLLQTTNLIANDWNRRRISENGSGRFAKPSSEPYMLFSAFTHQLRRSQTVLSMTGTILAPCSSGQTFAPKVLADSFVHFLESQLTLSELEDIISIINICVTKLWSTVFLHRPKDATVTSFASLSGYITNTDQAILTEHVIWRGPRWVARVIEEYGIDYADCGSAGDCTEARVPDRLVTNGIWTGSQADGAILAANGMARLLWRERQRKIDEQQKHASREGGNVVRVSEVHTNPQVWRGSSGDL
ncbi:hypothetical protein PV10_07464 [Exophiala mesophila]|uniref:F-box domain-containing protein n=1 Tax=Exophiala mesophila TaxID=212818 RepID=A0A0D1ZTL4_EXOME|nr:uncharacterized protein PV10_07464 [Exophiala mesophila]KIV90123.1 hypothetical protein PV10_07464 [Exophiala mesophila]